MYRRGEEHRCPNGGPAAPRGRSEVERRACRVRERLVEDLAERDAVVGALRDAGVSLREIGELVGVSHGTVATILARVRPADA